MNHGIIALLNTLPITPPEAKLGKSSKLRAASPQEDKISAKPPINLNDKEKKSIYRRRLSYWKIAQQPRSNSAGMANARIPKAEKRISALHEPTLPPKFFTGAFQVVCDQLGSEGLKLNKATIKKSALKHIASKITSNSRLPLLSFLNLICLSSVYSWLIIISLLTDVLD